MTRRMIQSGRKLDEFSRRLYAEENLSFQEALAIYEMLHKEAVSLGAINSENILDGLGGGPENRQGDKQRGFMMTIW